jgi:hypothetical protein
MGDFVVNWSRKAMKAERDELNRRTVKDQNNFNDIYSIIDIEFCSLFGEIVDNYFKDIGEIEDVETN